MDILDINDNRISPEQKTSVDIANPALEEVIAEIDRDISQIHTPEPGEIEENRKLSSAIKTRITQFILITLENNFFALPLSNALEIGHRPDIAPLPNLPNWILGISNIRGEIISLVNLKTFLRIPSSGAKRDRRFVIVYNQDMKVGIAVDKTPGIISMDEENFDNQTNPYQQGEFVKYIRAVSVSGENVINIFDTDRLLSSLRITNFETD